MTFHLKRLLNCTIVVFIQCLVGAEWFVCGERNGIVTRKLMCILAKLFSISIIIENNFAGVNMSFWVPSDRTRAGFTVSLIHIFLVDLLL